MGRGRCWPGLAVVALLAAAPALTGCAAGEIAAPQVSPSAAATQEPSRAATGYATNYPVEEQLDQLITDIEQDREEEDIPGLAGVEIDGATGVLTVYWVGEPPEHVRRVAAGAPAGITVDLKPATYDLQAMIAALDKLFASDGDLFSGGSPNTDGSGITVERTKAQAAKGPTPDELTVLAGIPVTAELGEPAEPAVG